MMITIKMYYNILEFNKIGFYPKLNNENMNREIYISFYLKEINNEYYWIQQNQSVIYGFTKKNGYELLYFLNKEIKNIKDVKNIKIQAKYIMNLGGRQIYPMSDNATYYMLENYNN
jgi:hypothetical protein